eukprot:934073_1
MSSLVTVTLPHEGEQEDVETGFNFDEWIIENELESIKQILIQHKANTLSRLRVDATEFQSVVTDPQMLAKAHMLPQLMKSVYNISKLKLVTIVVADEEQQVIDSIKHNLKSLNQTQQDIEKLRVDHPTSIKRINASKLEGVKQAELKVNQIFDQLCDVLNARRKAILKQIDEIKSNVNRIGDDDDEKEVDMISLCTESIDNCTQFLKQQHKAYNTLTSTNENRADRKVKILDVGQKVSDEFQKTQTLLKENMENITRQITANNAVIVDIDFVVKSNLHNRLIACIQKFGMVKNKIYNSDQERTNDEVVESDDDEVVIRRLKQQLEAKINAFRELEAEKVTHQERIQELETNVTNLTSDQQRNMAQLEAKTQAVRELQAEKITQQGTIQELQTNVTNISTDQQRNLARLKESLSFSANNEQRFRWLRNGDDEKKENDMEFVKIVADNPIHIVFVDGKRQVSSNDVLSLAPPVNSIDGICKYNKQIINGVQTLMKEVYGEQFVYRFDFDTNGICYALG